ncbi:hypothetical protein BG006_007069 [Podila minutissima]|uniref:Uncharacterized protein n=1 Tax=Podila minutissima TaxID=64525 RepID=A0A9P5SHS4_9FUNG|nr:hypothetical protein BG006_007069 [Podila minutissima]
MRFKILYLPEISGSAFAEAITSIGDRAKWVRENPRGFVDIVKANRKTLTTLGGIPTLSTLCESMLRALFRWMTQTSASGQACEISKLHCNKVRRYGTDSMNPHKRAEPGLF